MDEETKISIINQIKDDTFVDINNNLVLNPYNPQNKEIKLNEVQYILTKYGVPDKVHNFKLYKRAFVHTSYVKRPELDNKELGVILAEKPSDCLPLSTKSNERLEFLGDGVLELVVKYYLYRRFPKADEGFMTEVKIALIKNEHIGKIAYEMGLHKWFILSKWAEEKGNRSSLKKLGCLFEAFLGALFLDFNKIIIKDEDSWFQNVFVCGPGFQIAQIFLENILENHVDWNKLISTDENFKHQLQIKVQKIFKITPNYFLIEKNLQTFGYKMGVYICLNQNFNIADKETASSYEEFGSFDNILEKSKLGDKILIKFAVGEHKNKRKAEQIACEIALKMISDSEN
jgi:dsRNA-specific ribonuclease